MSRGTVSKYVDDKTGRELWRYRVDLGGGRGNRRQAQRSGFKTRKAAFDAMDARIAADDGISTRNDTDLIVYLERWVETRRDLGTIKPATADSYAEKVRRLATVIKPGVTLGGLATIHVDDAYRKLARAGVGPRTLRYIHQVLRQALDDAIAKGELGRNPARGATVPSASAAKPRERKVWPVADGHAFLAWEEIPDNRRAAWSIVLGAGLRCAELAALRWSDITGDTLSVSRSRYVDRDGVAHEDRPKTAAAIRDIPLPRHTLDELRKWRRTQAEQFLAFDAEPRRDRTYIATNRLLRPHRPNDLTQRWLSDVRAAVKAGVVPHPMTLHDGRHWYATTLVANGVDLRTVAYLLGHTDPGFTLRTYGHADMDRARAAAATLG